MRRIIFTVLVFFGMISSVKAYVWDNIWADKVIRILYILSSGQQYTFETRNLSYGGDTIMYLVRDNGDGTYTQVAYNDDCPGGGLRSCITYTPTQSGTYWIIIRAYSNSSKGYCDYYFNNQNILINTYFGGTIIYLSPQYPIYAQDMIYSLLVPNGTNDTHLYFFTLGDYFITMDDDGGIGRGSGLVMPSNYWGGRIVVAKHSASDNDGYTRVIHNSGTDYDGDGLRHNLENYLMTCEKGSGYQNSYCDNVFNPRDTDGDGIDDFVEVMGCDRQCVSGGNVLPGCYGPEHTCISGTLTKNWSFPQYLYNWGANPRRKDVFFEMDRNMMGGIPQEQNLIRIYQKYRDNNSTIINSDGSKGIFPHFDVGNSGIVCSDVQICGNWGGGGDNVGTCDYNIGYREKFSIIRKGLFHYALGCAGAGGGQSPSTYTDLFGYGVYGDYDGIDNFLHESGHNNGLPDGGTESAGIYNYKPHYTSVMNYAYCHGFDGSVANVHYSNGQYTKILNSTRLCESEGIGTTTRPTFLENSCFKYKVNDNGGVDWNRDGVIKNCIDPQCDDLVADGCVRAYINFCDSSTDALRYRQNLSWNNGIKTSYRPELVAFNGSLYMFIRKYLPGYGDDSNITYYRFTGFSGCDAHGRTPCDNWEQIGTVPIELTNYGPVTASSTIVNGEFRLYVFFRGTNDQIYYRYMNSSGQWSNNSISIGGSTNYTEVGSVSYYRYGLMFIWVGYK